MNVDCNLFRARKPNTESDEMLKNYLYKQNPNLEFLVK